MDDVRFRGREVPLITKTGAPGDVARKPIDRYVTPSERTFVEKNSQLQGSMGSDDENVRKSTLVEIPTPTSRVVFKTDGVFPFDFFPDSLIIDELKVSYIFRKFIYQQVNSILIKDIVDVTASNGLFFGSVQITGGEFQGTSPEPGMEKGPLIVSYLKKNDAYLARQIILGLMIYSDQKVDTSRMPVTEVIQKARELGRSRA